MSSAGRKGETHPPPVVPVLEYVGLFWKVLSWSSITRDHSSDVPRRTSKHGQVIRDRSKCIVYRFVALGVLLYIVHRGAGAYSGVTPAEYAAALGQYVSAGMSKINPSYGYEYIRFGVLH